MNPVIDTRKLAEFVPQAAAARMVEAETARGARIVQATGFKGD